MELNRVIDDYTGTVPRTKEDHVGCAPANAADPSC